jgi:hypothetical protein
MFYRKLSCIDNGRRAPQTPLHSRRMPIPLADDDYDEPELDTETTARDYESA